MELEPVEPEAPEEPESAAAIARARGATLAGLAAAPVEVEVRVLRGLLGLVKIIGLPDSALRESRERVASAVKAAGLRFPDRSLLINLAPAELRKVGPGLDLPIAAAILAATGQVPAEALDRVLLFGELALDGRVRAVRGAVPVALHAVQAGLPLLLPAACVAEIELVRGLRFTAVEHLGEVVAFLATGVAPTLTPPRRAPPPAGDEDATWDSIVGQDEAKQALVVAAAGGHHLLLSGPPGTGKSMLARSLASLLPELDDTEALEVSCIHSAAGLPARTGTRRPPLRAPHCSVTMAGMAGGGLVPRPGELTLSHRGLLFLDELPQFRREVVDLLRAPLEEGRILLARAGRSLEFPARFQLVAAMNPCPCGNAGEPGIACSCSPAMILRHRSRVTGPVLDRVDISIRVPFVPAELRRPSSATLAAGNVRTRITAARRTMRERNDGALNADVPATTIGAICRLEALGGAWLGRMIDRLRLSVRAHHRILRVARTLADLEGAAAIGQPHLVRSLSLREPEPAALERG